MLEQQREISGSFAQWRQVDAQAAQSIVEIGAEFARGDHGLQIAIGRRDHAHVGGNRLIAADAFKLLLLQHAQHLGLQQQRHVADLIKE